MNIVVVKDIINRHTSTKRFTFNKKSDPKKRADRIILHHVPR